MNLLDYLKEKNDISLLDSSFNDIDNVILSYLSYIDFGELFVDKNSTCNIEDIFELFCKRHSIEEIRENGGFTKKAPLLLEEMIKGKRFKGSEIGYYEEDFDEEKVKQFAAVTFILPDGTNYIAFRGTDSTITGWKEDFLMSCTSETEGAKEAVDYLNIVSDNIKGDLMLGGHSKGGNFAMYASTFCNEVIKNRIVKVYNNDGPGFRDEIICSEEYKHSSEKIRSIVPQTSIIGQLLSNEGEQKVVKSNVNGIFQHDAMTWEIMDDEFVGAELDAISEFVKIALGSWLEQTDDETRQSIVSTIFSIIEETQVKDFKEFGSSLLKNSGTIIMELVNLPKAQRDELMKAFTRLIKAGGEAILDNIPIVSPK